MLKCLGIPDTSALMYVGHVTKTWQLTSIWVNEWQNKWMNEFVFAPSYRALIETYHEGAVCPSYACLYSSVSLLQKPVRLRSRTVSGSEFQIEGPEVAKLRDPYRASPLRGIVRSWQAAERRCWRMTTSCRRHRSALHFIDNWTLACMSAPNGLLNHATQRDKTLHERTEGVRKSN